MTFISLSFHASLSSSDEGAGEKEKKKEGAGDLISGRDGRLSWRSSLKAIRRAVSSSEAGYNSSGRG
ncbi:hypothetical protein SRHO_G00001220 [Serrasalmus rhombeus]